MNHAFISSTVQELPLETSWEDNLARNFTVTSIDFETNPVTRIPTEIGMVKINLGSGLITQAYWSRISGEPGCLQRLYPELRPYLRDSILLAHNKATEKRCLWLGLAIPPPPKLWLDSLNIFRGLMPILRSYELGEVAAHLGLKDQIGPRLVQLGHPEGLKPHHALWDAAAAGLALATLLQMERLQHLSLRQLSTMLPSQGLRPRVVRSESQPLEQDNRRET